MLFNSPEFIFAFLPLTLAVFYCVTRLLGSGPRGATAAKAWLLAASLFFYGYWDARYLPLLVVSLAFNYILGRAIASCWGEKGRSSRAKVLLVLGVTLNLASIGLFKYAAFVTENLNRFLGLEVPVLRFTLPLGISFFTFQEVAFLIDVYRMRLPPDEHRRAFRPIDFPLFISFFPQLIAGPIVRHDEILPQLSRPETFRPDFTALSIGLWTFIAGLFKKIVIADTFATWAAHGFDVAPTLNLLEAWATSLSYAFQLYFDFSGYSDMAIGCGLMLNIAIPINFNSPYKALSIQDFWRRWHITLSTFLRDYLYVPLGGGRHGIGRTVLNLFMTFLLGGLWHGAGWMFVLWGLLHGGMLAGHRLWGLTGIRLPRALAWLLTFNAVNVAWVFFRAQDLGAAWKVLRGMAGMAGVALPERAARWLGSWSRAFIHYGDPFPASNVTYWTLLAVACGLAMTALPNTNELRERFQWSPGRLLWGVAMAVVVVICSVFLQVESAFIYWQF